MPVAAWLLALANNVYLAPMSQAALGRLQDRLKSSQVSFEVQPRVFYEGFPKRVLYVQDVKSARGAAIWKGVFIADTSNAAAPTITLAQQGILVSQEPDTLHLHLSTAPPKKPMPRVPTTTRSPHSSRPTFPSMCRRQTSRSRKPAPIAQLGTWELPVQGRKQNAWSRDGISSNFTAGLPLPIACLVLALVGIPLGLSSKKGGKSAGFVLTILLVFAYYSVSLVGVSLARQGKVTPDPGRVACRHRIFPDRRLSVVAGGAPAVRDRIVPHFWKPFKGKLKEGILLHPTRGEDVFERAAKRRRVFSARFPMILDDYVLRDFAMYLAWCC